MPRIKVKNKPNISAIANNNSLKAAPYQGEITDHTGWLRCLTGIADRLRPHSHIIIRAEQLEKKKQKYPALRVIGRVLPGQSPRKTCLPHHEIDLSQPSEDEPQENTDD